MIFDLAFTRVELPLSCSYRYRWDCPFPVGAEKPLLSPQSASALARLVRWPTGKPCSPLLFCMYCSMLTPHGKTVSRLSARREFGIEEMWECLNCGEHRQWGYRNLPPVMLARIHEIWYLRGKGKAAAEHFLRSLRNLCASQDCRLDDSVTKYVRCNCEAKMPA